MRIACLSMLIIVGIFQITHAQPTKRLDSLCVKICDAIVADKDSPDSTRILNSFVKHIVQFAIQEKLVREQLDSIGQLVFFRLQRNCPEYKAMLEKAEPTKGDWKEVTERPPVKLRKKECSEFLSIKKYKYLEHNGDTVNLEINKGLWIDHFNDGTWSKLKFVRTDDCSIEIEFIESNNRVRKNYSRKGDKYRYQILEKGDHYYLLLAESEGSESMTTFKMYVER